MFDSRRPMTRISMTSHKRLQLFQIRHAFAAFGLCLALAANAQQSVVDSLRAALGATTNDTIKVVLLANLTEVYSEISPDSSYNYSIALLNLARKLSFRLNEANAQSFMAYAYLNNGDFPRSLRTLLSALAITEDPESESRVLPRKYYAQMIFWGTRPNFNTPRINAMYETLFILGILYSNVNYSKALDFMKQALRLAEDTGNRGYVGAIYSGLSRVYMYMNKPDSALHFGMAAYELLKRYNGPRATVVLNLGRTHLAIGDSASAVKYVKEAVNTSIYEGYFRGIVAGNLLLSNLYKKTNGQDSSLHFAYEGLAIAKQLNSPDLLERSYTVLASIYNASNARDSTIKYLSLVNEMNGKRFNAKQAQEFQNIEVDEMLRQREIQEAESAFQNRLQKYVLFVGLVILGVVALFLWRISYHRQKSNTILRKQKKEIEMAMTNLKSAQTQLIQSEKMASLGELTAGIAHEIQNPLNFVNNFSEVNSELIEELKSELSAGNYQSVETIADGIKANQEKINAHGKRADGIVKSMLQHSRASTGQKEPTDLNALCEEYLRLAYHGLRAKDKSFNTAINTNFDEKIGNISIVRQDIGRVILNLLNNAFYAVGEKSKQPVHDFEPAVSVTTKKTNDTILISIKDNGIGIDHTLLEKIFQPFFTTKPTGQGTGLGLSLSYDIAKAHGGELKVETQEGEGSTFTFSLPSNNNV